MDFLRLEGYEAGEYCFVFLGKTKQCVEHYEMNGSGQHYFVAGKKFTNFDTSPKGFVALVPSFWSWPMWKSAIYIQYDVVVLEQVCYHTSLLTSKLFAHFLILGTSSCPRHVGGTLWNST